jgi:peptidoglycan/xylan/chitin deacetylase (PgdA/CDA1 family)
MGWLTTWWKPLSAGALAVVVASAVAGCAGTATASERPSIPAPAPVAPATPAPALREGADPSAAAAAVDPPGGLPRPAGAPRPDPRVLATVRLPADAAPAPGADAHPAVALTFDDGPDPVWTPRVLALLHSYDDVATFCMIGQQAAARPDLVRAVVAAGMRLCDHTRDHDQRLRSRPPAVLDPEITGAQTELRSISGAPVRYYRSPGGDWSQNQLDLAIADGMQPLGWSVDPQDWRRPGTDAIVTRVESGLRPGGIVLLHDGGGDRSQTLAALQRLLPWLRDGHYRTVFPTPFPTPAVSR